MKKIKRNYIKRYQLFFSLTPTEITRAQSMDILSSQANLAGYSCD